MQYKNYEIQITQDGVIIRNSIGMQVGFVSTEEEAYEYIDEGVYNHKETHVHWNEAFEVFCRVNKLNIVFLDGKHIATQNEKKLKKLIDEFEAKSGMRATYETLYVDGEYFYQVCDF